MKTSIGVWSPSLAPNARDQGLFRRAEANFAEVNIGLNWAPSSYQQYLQPNNNLVFEALPLAAKLSDLAWALETNQKLLLCTKGGYDAYSLLGEIDWRRLKQADVTLVGHSDFTALANAYYARTGRQSWYGSNLRNLGDPDTGRVATQNFIQALTHPTTVWRAQPVYKDGFDKRVEPGASWWTIRPGRARGIGIGGNVGTFFLLQGTHYMPAFDQPTILILEEDEMPGVYAIREFDRKLRSILDQPGAKENIKGLVVGRFLEESRTTRAMICQVIDNLPFFDALPVLANVDIGHGMPRILLPIGGKIDLDANLQTITVYNSKPIA